MEPVNESFEDHLLEGSIEFGNLPPQGEVEVLRNADDDIFYFRFHLSWLHASVQFNLLTDCMQAAIIGFWLQPMTHHTRQRNQRGRSGREFGLVTRVAKRLGKSKALVSMVKNGRAKSQLVQQALDAERAAMRAEALGKKEAA